MVNLIFRSPRALIPESQFLKLVPFSPSSDPRIKAPFWSCSALRNVLVESKQEIHNMALEKVNI